MPVYGDQNRHRRSSAPSSRFDGVAWRPELLRFGQRRCAGRWASVTGGLLIRVANLDQRRFTPGPAKYLRPAGSPRGQSPSGR